MQKFASLLATHALALSFFAVLLLIVVLGAVAKQQAYTKTQPYQVHLDVTASQNGVLRLAYDYGYGPLPEHARVIPVQAGKNQVQTSISAWKSLRTVSLSADEPGDYQISEISIFKASASPLVSQQNLTLNGESADSSVAVSLVDR